MQPLPHPFTPSETSVFKEMAVEIANRIQTTLTGDFAEVRALVDKNEIVFAIWQDRAEPDGVGMILIKGPEKLREIVASRKSRELMWTAIPCVCAEQAYALLQVAGERDRRH